ncbi:hypothetical protein U9134_25380 [Escherichia coli]
MATWQLGGLPGMAPQNDNAPRSSVPQPVQYQQQPNVGLKWFTEFGHLNRGDMLTSEQHRCHNEKKKFQRRV